MRDAGQQGPLDYETMGEVQTVRQGQGWAAPPEQGTTQPIFPHLYQPNAWPWVHNPPMCRPHPGIQPEAALKGAPCSFGASWS